MKTILPALTLTVGAFVVLLAVSGTASADDDEIEVLTQNLYVGSDLFQILNPTNPVPVRAAKIFSDVQMTDFHQRAEVIADLIAAKRPHLVGLQEVSLLRTECPSSIVITGDPTPDAKEVFADYRQILLDALAARGLDYKVAAAVQNVDVELPVLNAPGLLTGCPATTMQFFDARLTDFDVTLVRGDVTASVVLEKRFIASLPIPISPEVTITFHRGFTVVDANVDGRESRFVNLHLEVGGNPIANFFQFAQAHELTQTLDLLATLPGGDKPLIVAGDFNSSPDAFYADCTLPDPFGPVVANGCLTPYGFMVVNGYADLWDLRDDDEWKPGYTCCQAPLLTNAESELSTRIDHIWYRGPLSAGGGVEQLDEVEAEVRGTRKKDRTVDGLWPSDHAGVLAELEFEE